MPSALVSNILKTDKHTDQITQEQQQQQQQIKLTKTLVTRTKEIFLFEQLLKHKTARGSFPQPPFVHSVRLERHLKSQLIPSRTLHLTNSREDFFLVAHDFCVYFLVNWEPQRKEIQFFRYDQVIGNVIEEKCSGKVL